MKENDIQISVTFNGSEVYRKFTFSDEDFEHFTSDKERMGAIVEDMFNTIIDAEKI
jgi:hypothetical protein